MAVSLALLGSLLGSGSALAQSPQAAPPHETPRLAAPDAPKPPPEEVRPADRGAATGGENMTDKLSKQQGTLQPPAAVDPGIHAPLPPRTSGTMPVIPPPGTPGGDPKVVPK